MMNFRSVKKKKEQKKRGLAFGVVVLLVVLGFTGVYRSISSGFHPLSVSFWKFRSGDGTALSFVLKDKKRLQEKVETLETELRARDLELMRLEMFRLENETLKNALTTIESYNPITASILIKPNFTLYDTLIVDVGTQDGVEEGDIVVAYGSVAIGKVKDVRKNISYIELFSESKVQSLLVHNMSGTYVDAVGQGGGMVLFTLPREANIAVGDFLSLPARSGLLFGTVENIKFDATDPVQTVLAQSAVNINQLQYVEIIPGYEEQF